MGSRQQLATFSFHLVLLGGTTISIFVTNSRDLYKGILGSESTLADHEKNQNKTRNIIPKGIV